MSQMVEGLAPNAVLRRKWLGWGYAVTVVMAAMLVAHNVNQPPGVSMPLLALYWLVRLSAGYVLFFGALLVLESTPFKSYAGWPACAVLAMTVTLMPFVFLVTMLDLSIGLPELDNALNSSRPAAVLYSLVREAFYLLDNYLFSCLAMLLPRLWIESPPLLQDHTPVEKEHLDITRNTGGTSSSPSFLDRTEPRVSGDIFCIEAQEHYIKVSTGAGSGLALYRFGDALRELKHQEGIQIHRSFWVADRAVVGLAKSRQGMRLTLRDGSTIPVSRRFEMTATARYADAAAG